MKRILIFGATSAIAREAERRMARRGDALFLVARDAAKLEDVAADLRSRGASRVATRVVDALDFSRHPGLAADAAGELGGLDAALVAHGTLGDQARGQADFADAERELRTNLLAVLSVLTPLANFFEAQGAGVLAVISSVAGDRGRQSNYIYGTAKAGLNTFLQGLRHRLHRRGVRVLCFKPGFVDTPMTAHLKKNFLFASPERVAAGMLAAMDRGEGEIYLPRFWRWVMLLIKNIPDFLFLKTKL